MPQILLYQQGTLWATGRGVRREMTEGATRPNGVLFYAVVEDLRGELCDVYTRPRGFARG